MQGGFTMTFRPRHRLPIVSVAFILLLFTMAVPTLAGPPEQAGNGGGSGTFTPAQRRALQQIAQDTWNFYAANVDTNTALPRDNIGFNGAPAQGNYTSPTNIGVYLWSIVAAADMHLINRQQAVNLISRTLTTVERLRKWNGFLLSWYDTTNAHCVQAPNGPDCETGSLDGLFVSNVDNGWYGAGLVVTRQYIAENNSRESRDIYNRLSALLG